VSGWETKDGGYVRGLRLHGVGVEDATEMEARYLSVSARGRASLYVYNCGFNKKKRWRGSAVKASRV